MYACGLQRPSWSCPLPKECITGDAMWLADKSELQELIAVVV
jgi:hypothetical protein